MFSICNRKGAQQILEETKLPVDRMCEILLTLENAGFIKEVYKNYYIKCMNNRIERTK